MKITKFGHACLLIEHGGQSLLVDPGHWTADLVVPANVIGVIITHDHQDHLDPEKLRAIADKNPDVKIIGHETILASLQNFKTLSAVANENMTLGSFDLSFFGGEHAHIHSRRPVGANLGVMINGTLYYPGDSFALPVGSDSTVLALPIAAPWLKFSETADFITNAKAKIAFPTHDAILSDLGKKLLDRMATDICESVGTSYRRIDKSPLEI